MLQRARNTVQFVNNGTVPHPARRLAALSSPVAVSILPISYLIGERQLLFYRRLLCSDNIVLRTLARLVRFEMLLLNMILRVYIFPQQQLRMQFGHHL